MPTELPDSAKVLRNDVGKRMAIALEAIAQGGGGGASVVQKTMAEYTALPTSEKMNGSIYKITDKALIYCLDEEYHALKEIASADYALLTSAEKNNGTLYIITDEETTAADIPYSAGVSVADKLDDVPTFDTLTTSDNNKLLGVSVSGSDISVGAVDSRGVLDYQTYTLTYNTVDYVFTKRGHIVSINFSKNSQTTFTTAWSDIGTLPSGLYYGTIFVGALIPDNHRLLFRVASDGKVSVMCDTANNVWAQGSAIYMI